MNHYVYLITDDAVSNYIGVRSCKCLIQDDTKYWGSSKCNPANMRETHNKIILKRFDTRKEANHYEQEMHDLFDVSNNSQFWNIVAARGDQFKFGVGRNHPNYDHTTYNFIHIDGSVLNGTKQDIIQTCNIDPSSISALCKGKRKSVQGWRLVTTSIQDIGQGHKNHYRYDHTIYEFIRPDGIKFTGTKYDFRHKYNLESSGVSSVCSGKRRSLLGWRLTTTQESEVGTKLGPNHHYFDHTIYNFYHPDIGNILVTKHYLYNNYDISPSEVYTICSKPTYTCQGWTLVS